MCQSFKNICTLKMETESTENYDQVESAIKPDEPPPVDEKSEAVEKHKKEGQTCWDKRRLQEDAKEHKAKRLVASTTKQPGRAIHTSRGTTNGS